MHQPSKLPNTSKYHKLQRSIRLQPILNHPVQNFYDYKIKSTLINIIRKWQQKEQFQSQSVDFKPPKLFAHQNRLSVHSAASEPLQQF